MNRRGLISLSLCLGVTFIASCGQKAATSPTVARGNTDSGTGGTPTVPGATPGTGTTPGTTPGGPIVLPSQLAAKSQAFFDNKVIPLVKSAPCTDCHADPRMVVIQNGGLKPQSHTNMYALLKDGKGANDNKLFNMMRGLVPHPGGAQCTTETSPFCAVLQEWYREVFGDGVLSLGRVNDISPSSGSISGWSGISTAATTFLKVRFYLDGETGKVPMLGEVTANLEGSDNNIDGAHAFVFKVPVANIDNRPHKLYVYAVNPQGQEVPLSGSPYTYTVFKPKNTPAAIANYNSIFNGCNGACHGFTYESKWSSLVGGFGTQGWSRTNNTLVNKFRSGQHGGPAFNANMVTTSETWWTAEFPEVVP